MTDAPIYDELTVTSAFSFTRTRALLMAVCIASVTSTMETGWTKAETVAMTNKEQTAWNLDDALWAKTLSFDVVSQWIGNQVICLYPDVQAETRTMALCVTRLQERGDCDGMRQFSIQLIGDLEPQLVQRTYRIRTSNDGDFPLFITPVGRTATTVEYEACFSHAR